MVAVVVDGHVARGGVEVIGERHGRRLPGWAADGGAREGATVGPHVRTRSSGQDLNARLIDADVDVRAGENGRRIGRGGKGRRCWRGGRGWRWRWCGGGGRGRGGRPRRSRGG